MGRHISVSARIELVAIAVVLVLVAAGYTHVDAAEQNEQHEHQQQQQQQSIVKQEVEDKLDDFNRVVQGDAFKSFRHPKTGVVFDVKLNVSERASAQVVRLRTGSLRRRGFTFNEFTIPSGSGPVGVYPVRVVLVYRRFTDDLYQLVNLTMVSPVVGIKVYDAFNLSDTEPVPELDFQTSAFSNVTVTIPATRSALSGVFPLCATFGRDGGVSTANSAGSGKSGTYACSGNHLGDFALVLPSSEVVAPAPAPGEVAPSGSVPGRRKRRSKRWKVILAAVVGGVVGLAVVVVVGVLLARVLRRSRIAKMEKQSDRGEMLQTSLIGSSRAPTAGVSRTKPVLESDYAA